MIICWENRSTFCFITFKRITVVFIYKNITWIMTLTYSWKRISRMIWSWIIIDKWVDDKRHFRNSFRCLVLLICQRNWFYRWWTWSIRLLFLLLRFGFSLFLLRFRIIFDISLFLFRFRTLSLFIYQ